MKETDAGRINANILAYIGDAVYEVIVRERIISSERFDVSRAHGSAVKYVSAAGQAKAARRMLADGFLTDEEAGILRRARNHRSMSRPQHADPKDYKYATGFEAMIGYLHLCSRDDRIREISEEAFRIIESQ